MSKLHSTCPNTFGLEEKNLFRKIIIITFFGLWANLREKFGHGFGNCYRHARRNLLRVFCSETLTNHNYSKTFSNKLFGLSTKLLWESLSKVHFASPENFLEQFVFEKKDFHTKFWIRAKKLRFLKRKLVCSSKLHSSLLRVQKDISKEMNSQKSYYFNNNFELERNLFGRVVKIAYSVSGGFFGENLLSWKNFSWLFPDSWQKNFGSLTIIFSWVFETSL